MRAALLLFLAAGTLHAQWQLQPSNTTADLRGIHALGNGIAWASGSHGTVLHTTDNGATWQTCSTPPAAEALDFRGIQAFDAQTAIVMSSGTGDLSRFYKTADGCKTWKLVFTNPDPKGFWDAIAIRHGRGFLIGDPVEKRFAVFAAVDPDLLQWKRFGETSTYQQFRFDFFPYEGEGLFAASNSSMNGDPSASIVWITGGARGAFLCSGAWTISKPSGYPVASFSKTRLPLATGEGAGAFSLAGAEVNEKANTSGHLVVVGGSYKQPEETAGTAAFSKDGGRHWKAAITPPHGYRSAVAYSAPQKTWITVGPNGTDISTDDGRNWHPLNPAPGEPDESQHWNALSLPFVVGPHGRIGRLRTSAFTSNWKLETKN